MNQETKEKFAFELRFKQIQAMDKDMTAMFYKVIAGFGIIIWFLFYFGVLDAKNAVNVKLVFNISSLILLYIVVWQLQINKYLDDCYNGLFNAIKNNKLFEFYIRPMKWYHAFYYPKNIRNFASKSIKSNKKLKLINKNHIMNYTYSYFGGIFAALAIAYILGQNPFGFPWYLILGFTLLTYSVGLFCVTIIAFAFAK